MKKIIYILSPLLLLVLFLIVYNAYNGIIEERDAYTEISYRPMIMYNDEYYLIVANGRNFDLSEDELDCIGVLTSNVSIHNLPMENMQSCGAEYLVGQNMYITEKYPYYLFLYKEDGVLVPFVLESAR